MSTSTSASSLSEKEKRRARARGREIAGEAEAFFLAAQVLRRAVRRIGNPSMADIPVAVNAAMALEYFKSLITLEYGKYKWKHDLEYLFGKLSPAAQKRLLREHKPREKDKVFDRLRRDGIGTDLPNLLYIGRNTFYAFRYRHQNPKGGEAWCLDPCMLLMRNIVHKKMRVRPDSTFVEQHYEPFPLP